MGKKKRKHIKAPVSKNFVHKSLNSSTARLCLRMCLPPLGVCMWESEFPDGFGSRKEEKNINYVEDGNGEKEKLIMMKWEQSIFAAKRS